VRLAVSGQCLRWPKDGLSDFPKKVNDILKMRTDFYRDFISEAVLGRSNALVKKPEK